MWIIALLAGCLASAPAAPVPSPWTTLVPGLELAQFALTPSHVGDSTLHVARVDPHVLRLELHLATEEGGRPLPVDAWLDRTAALVAINPAMFSSGVVGGAAYTATARSVNNPRWAAGQRSVLALDPITPTDPAFHIYNLGCGANVGADPATETAGYRTRMQSIRGLGCAGENVWSDQPKEWSAAMVGEDGEGRALFLFVRSPYRMHDLIDQLRALPLDLRAIQYGEGGPEAFLAVRTPALTTTWTGSWETAFNENDDVHDAGDLPNVLIARASTGTADPGAQHTSRQPRR